MDEGAPVLREDLAGKTEGAHGPRRHHNHIFTWEIGDQDGTDQAFDRADVTVKELISYQRVHPSPMETCACIGSMDKIKGELTVYGTRSEEHTSELQSLMRISYAVFCLKQKKQPKYIID